jgi:Tol biopolymer transport system component
MSTAYRSIVAAFIVLASNVVSAQITTRVSVGPGGQQANGPSTAPAFSSDGRFVVFSTTASNLVPNDTNGCADVVLYDRLTRSLELISVSSAGVQGDGSSGNPTVSADGRYVLFESEADNLVPSDTNGTGDVFLRDRLSGTTERVSLGSGNIEANGRSGTTDHAARSMSDDGRVVCFWSEGDNLVPNDTNGFADVFVHDRLTGATSLISVAPDGSPGNSFSYAISISGDAHYAAFQSLASNLVSQDNNGAEDVFIRDLAMGTTILASRTPSGDSGDGTSWIPTLSHDGRYVAFASRADNLVANDHNANWDIFVYDQQTSVMTPVSVTSTGDTANGQSYVPSISSDGRFVAFESSATNLVTNDANAVNDIFVRDLVALTTVRMSVDSAGNQSNGASAHASISGDGLRVTFSSDATNLVDGDTNASTDVFIHDPIGPANYCTAKTNSLGCLPQIGSSGMPSVSGPDNFYVTASNIFNNKLGIMLWSLAPTSAPFAGGTLCLHSPIVRTPPQFSGGSAQGNDCTGTYAFHFSQNYMVQQLLVANTTVYAQYWCRDPGFAPPNNIGLTDALYFTITP